MYKAQLVGGEHDGLLVDVDNSYVSDIYMPRLSTGPAIFKPDDIKVIEANNIVVNRYIRQVFVLANGTEEPRWVLIRNGVPVL